MDPKPRILVVDDNAIKRYVLAEGLRREGFEVTEAPDADEALRVASSSPVPDAIILDVDLKSALDGFGVLQLLKSSEATSSIPVIQVSTVFTERAATVRALEAGAMAYLPYHDPAVVLATVRMVLRVAAAETELRRLVEFRERLLGIVSHDLRSPLQAVTLSAGALLRNESLSTVGRRQVGRIESSAARMSRMVSDLLDLTRGRLGGGIPVEQETTDVFVVCTEMVDEMRAAQPLRTIELQTRGHGVAVCDRERIAQVVGNLVDNALKYSSPETVVSVDVDGTSEETIAIAITNAGPPIPAAVAASLFDPFRRGVEATSRPNGLRSGLGLGLYIVQQVVRAHGGSIRVNSDAAIGIRFTVILPRRTVTVVIEEN